MSATVGNAALGPPAPPPGRFVLWDITRVFARDPAARTRWEVPTTCPGIHAFIMNRLAQRLWHGGWLCAARLLAFLVRVMSNVDIHPGARIAAADGIDLDHQLIPDPTDKAMAGPPQHIQTLEARFAAVGVATAPACGGGEGRRACVAGVGSVEAR